VAQLCPRAFGWNSKVKAKVKVTLRMTVSQPVRPGVRNPSGTADQFFPLLSLIILRQFVAVVVGYLSIGRNF
jgi:hypothetical protein